MGEAFWAATRSHDSEVKVGAIIVNSEKRELSRGYNGFPSNIEDSGLDSHCPAKLKWMVHAEVNAVTNLNQKLLFSDQAEVYVTRAPCLECSKILWQKNIRIWNIPIHCIEVLLTTPSAIQIKKYNEDENQLFDLLLKNGLRVNYVDFNIDGMVKTLQDYKKTIR